MNTAMTTGAALMASTAMSNCWCLAASDARPGGMWGYQTNQMIRSAASARTNQMANMRQPCGGSDAARSGAARSGGGWSGGGWSGGAWSGISAVPLMTPPRT